ncbi:leucine-rich repeat domain-containing protein [Roseimaritima sediminicola]|uniref:leucine-rich repeat domain-containing protein n=1 Tax=Roseimaritima sediminicola TaxID=2662066 RepID=UPI001386BDF0|nr:leucine-rich repeat domain-containing protein [Roseimaritima sediminicola]
MRCCVFLCLTTAAAFSATCFADDDPPRLFPDPALEAAVRAEVFEKRYNDEPITKEDVQNISRVVGRGKGIKNLEGLQHCPAVMLLDLEDNEITDLKPIAELKRLQSVTLAGNKIKTLEPLKDLTGMQLLDVSRNQISDLKPLQKMANLRTLYVASNQLKTLEPIAQLTKIWSLDAENNQLSDLGPVAKLQWLSTLNVRSNAIEDLQPLVGLKELNLLLISNNKIKDLQPLVKMCQADAADAKRFAPYLRLYLGENPLSEQAKGEQIEALKAVGVDVFDE